MNLAKKIDRALTLAEKILLAAIFSAMVGLSFLQVILRLFFSTGFLWADIFLRHLVLWVGFLGAAIAASQGGHFAIDLVKKFLPEAVKKAVFVTVHLFACAVLFFLSGSALKFFKDELSARSILFTVQGFEFHSFWMTAIIPLGFVLLLIHFILRLLAGPAEDAPPGI